MTETSFAPRWASPPAETIKEALLEQGLSVEDLADRSGLSDAAARALVTGESSITPDLADSLAAAIGSTREFWLNREARYQEALNLVTADNFVQLLPKSHVNSLGWLALDDDWRASAHAFLEYFDLQIADQWTGLYGAARFRQSATFSSNQAEVAVWLRQGEIEAKNLGVGPWSPTRFREALADARTLTKLRDPREFIPKLQALFGRAGVALAVVRAPEGCKMSGAALRNRDGTRLIVVSARYLVDDHFWFTVFHEAAHMLLHDSSHAVLDELETPSESVLEVEANELARELLVPASLEFESLTYRAVAGWASQLGIAPGVLVGQLQHDGRVPHSQLNKLKRWYRWDGGTLVPK